MAYEDLAFPPLARSFLSSCFPRIKRSLPLDFSGDAATRDVMDRAVARAGVTDRLRAVASTRREGRNALIVAPGPSLEGHVDALVPLLARSPRPMALISVDGATRLFLERNIPVDAIVTDLDGLTTGDVVDAHDRWPCIIIVHGHGNNREAVEGLLDLATIDERYIFTTQVEPTRNVWNFGGFTDGDRAVFAGLALGFTRLVLIAMDLDSPVVGSYSKPGLTRAPEADRSIANMPVKQRKVQVALAILRWLSRELPPGCTIQTFRKRPPFEFFQDVASADEITGGST